MASPDLLQQKTAVLGEKLSFTRREAAELLNVSEAAVRLWEAQGKLHSLRFGRLRRIPASEIQRLLQYGLA